MNFTQPVSMSTWGMFHLIIIFLFQIVFQQSEAQGFQYFTWGMCYWENGSRQKMEMKYNTPIHLNVEQKLNFCWAPSLKRFVNVACTYRIDSAGFDYIGALQTTRAAPVWLLKQARLWPCAPATDSSDFSSEHSAWRKVRNPLRHRPDISPTTHLISSPLPRPGCAVCLWIKALSSTLFSICPNRPRSDLSQVDITIWAEIWPKIHSYC